MTLTVNYLLKAVVERKGQLTQTPKTSGSVQLKVFGCRGSVVCLTDEKTTFQQTANVLQHWVLVFPFITNGMV